MSGKTALATAVEAYVAHPGFASMRAVESALVGVPPEAAEIIRNLLEMVTSLKSEVASEKQMKAMALEALSKAVGTTVTNVAQAGGMNAAQTGTGSQTLSGDGRATPSDGKKQ